MSDLPKIVNTPIELEIGGVKIQAKKAGIYDLALLQDYMAKVTEMNPQTRDMKLIPYALFLCVKKVYPDTTEEYINELLPATSFLEKPDLVMEIMTKLGFFIPPRTLKEEKGETK